MVFRTTTAKLGPGDMAPTAQIEAMRPLPEQGCTLHWFPCLTLCLVGPSKMVSDGLNRGVPLITLTAFE